MGGRKQPVRTDMGDNHVGNGRPVYMRAREICCGALTPRPPQFLPHFVRRVPSSLLTRNTCCVGRTGGGGVDHAGTLPETGIAFRGSRSGVGHGGG